MEDLDQLGTRHRKLLAQLDALRPLLADAIRHERDNGATLQALVTRSGYGGIETIKQIIDPARRQAVYEKRNKTKAEDDQ